MTDHKPTLNEAVADESWVSAVARKAVQLCGDTRSTAEAMAEDFEAKADRARNPFIRRWYERHAADLRKSLNEEDA